MSKATKSSKKAGTTYIEFSPGEEKRAEFIAWLTDMVPYEDNKTIRLLNDKEASDKVSELYQANDNIAADIFLKKWNAAKKAKVSDAKINLVSKSVRISSKSFLSLGVYANENRIPYGDAIREMIAPRLMEKITDLRKSFKDRAVVEKIDFLETVYNGWHGRKPGTPRGRNDDDFLRMNMRFREFGHIDEDYELEVLLKKWFKYLLAEHITSKNGNPMISDALVSKIVICDDPRPSFLFYLLDDGKLSINMECLGMIRTYLPLVGEFDQKDLETIAQLLLDDPMDYFLDIDDGRMYTEWDITDHDQFENYEAIMNFLSNFTGSMDLNWCFDLAFSVDVIIGLEEIDVLSRNSTPATDDPLYSDIFKSLINQIPNTPDTTKFEDMKKKVVALSKKGKIEEATKLSNTIGTIETARVLSEYIYNEIVRKLKGSHVVTFSIPDALASVYESIGGKSLIEEILLENVEE